MSDAELITGARKLLEDGSTFGDRYCREYVVQLLSLATNAKAQADAAAAAREAAAKSAVAFVAADLMDAIADRDRIFAATREAAAKIAEQHQVACFIPAAIRAMPMPEPS